MLKDNLVILRNINGYSQEEVAEKIGISRQAYAKWEKGLIVVSDEEGIALVPAETFEEKMKKAMEMIYKSGEA